MDVSERGVSPPFSLVLVCSLYNYATQVPFTDEFKTRVRRVTNASVEFGVIEHDHWFQPDWVNETLAAENRRRMAIGGVPYADSVAYRNMCRFNSGVRVSPLIERKTADEIA